MAACRYHPDRPGVGICMRCRAVICTACCTRVDGVNHCHACLKMLGQGRDTVSAPAGNAGAILGALAVVGVIWLAFLGAGLLVQGILAP